MSTDPTGSNPGAGPTVVRKVKAVRPPSSPVFTILLSVPSNLAKVLKNSKSICLSPLVDLSVAAPKAQRVVKGLGSSSVGGLGPIPLKCAIASMISSFWGPPDPVPRVHDNGLSAFLSAPEVNQDLSDASPLIPTTL
ncbi:hypothetical protein D3C85_987840 [compost metagenome]